MSDPKLQCRASRTNNSSLDLQKWGRTSGRIQKSTHTPSTATCPRPKTEQKATYAPYSNWAGPNTTTTQTNQYLSTPTFTGSPDNNTWSHYPTAKTYWIAGQECHRPGMSDIGRPRAGSLSSRRFRLKSSRRIVNCILCNMRQKKKSRRPTFCILYFILYK